MNIQGWFPLGLNGLISLQSKRLCRAFSSNTIQKHQFIDTAFLMVQLSHLYMTTGETMDLTIWTYVSKAMALLFNMLPRFVVGTSGKEPTCQCRRCKRHGFDPWVGKIPWRRAWQPTPAFLLEKSHGRGAWRATVCGVPKSQTQLSTHTHTLTRTHTHTHTHA